LHWVRRLVGAGGEIEVEIAERRPGDSGVIAVPRLAPSATGPTGGVLAGLTLATTPADVHRAVVDGIALDLAGVARRSRRLGLVVDCWFGWGGGLGIAVLRQAVADALQAPLALCAPPGAVVAAADLAREVALGGAPRSVQELVQPDPGAAEAFADLAARTDELIRAYPGRLPRTDHRAGRPAREEEATCPD
jgi:sugar (pentulose or hexulose) kinase